MSQRQNNDAPNKVTVQRAMAHRMLLIWAGLTLGNLIVMPIFSTSLLVAFERSFFEGFALFVAYMGVIRPLGAK